MLGQVAGGLGGSVLGRLARQRQRHVRLVVKRPRVRRLRFEHFELGLARHGAVVVLNPVGEFERAVHRPLGFADEGNARGCVGNDLERPGGDLIRAGLQHQHAVGDELARKLPHAGVLSLSGIGRSLRGDLGGLAFRRRKHQRFLAATAGHAQRQVAALRRIEQGGLAIGVRGEEDRRLAGIGRRRDPGIDARRNRRDARRGAEGVGHLAAERSGRKGEGRHQQEQRHGAQAPGIAFGHAGAGQVARQAAELFGHPFLMLVPERLGETVGRAGQPVGLDEDGRVLEFVGPLDTAVDRGALRPAEVAQRSERGERREREGGRGADAQPVGHQPEQAEPGYAQEQAGDDDERQDQRPGALERHRRLRPHARAGKAAEHAGIRFGLSRLDVRHRPSHLRAAARCCADSMYEDSSKHGKGEAAHQNVKGRIGDSLLSSRRRGAAAPSSREREKVNCPQRYNQSGTESRPISSS